MEINVRIFLDSNVILLGLLSERGAPRILLNPLSLRLPFLIGSTGRYNLIEIERKLTLEEKILFIQRMLGIRGAFIAMIISNRKAFHAEDKVAG
jgi:hypothetical protein